MTAKPLHGAAVMVALLGVLTDMATAQGPPIFREPLRFTWPVRVVEPQDGLPLAIANAVFQAGNRIDADVRSLTLKTVPTAGILLRVAVGPTTHGMMTFRMRHERSRVPGQPGTLTTLLPHGPWIASSFRIVREDYGPPATALTRDREIVLTIERIDGGDGQAIFENPDAMELLWQALGRPRPRERY